MKIHTATFSPMMLNQAVATPDPDLFLLSGFFNRFDADAVAMLYSQSKRTISSVRLDGLLSKRLLYIDSIKRNAVIDRSRVSLIEDLPIDPPVDINAFIEQREKAAQEKLTTEAARKAEVQPTQALSTDADARLAAAMAKIEEVKKMTARLSGAQATQPPPPDARLSAMAEIADIEAVGVYESERASQGQDDGGSLRMAPSPEVIRKPRSAVPVSPPAPARSSIPGEHPPTGATGSRAVGMSQATGNDGSVRHRYYPQDVPQGSQRVAGTVQVRVRRGRPVLLVLSSYEPVRWVVNLEPGAKVLAVLRGGYYPSEVSGVGDARIYDIGRVYSYERGGDKYARLDKEVQQRTGKRIDTFQGRYRGSSFEVGGL